MSKEEAGIGIIGSRFAADFHVDSLRRSGKARIVAACSPSKPVEFAERWGIDDIYDDHNEMLKRDDIDIVSICSPNSTHAELTADCARAGKHVICEKPLATSLADAEQAVAACRESRVKLFYAEDWVFAPALTKVIETVNEGAIGDILYVKAKEVHNGTHSPYAKNSDTCGGGCLIHLAIHPVGWILHLLARGGENPVVEVVGKANAGLADNYVHKDNGGEDWSVGIMKFQDGQHAFVEGNYITVGGMDDKVEIYGTEGRIGADLTFGSPVTVYSRPGYSYAIEKTDNTLGWTRPAVDEFYNLGYVHELAYFVDCVLNDEEPLWGVSGEAGLACLGVIRAMYQSNQEGRTMTGTW